MKKLATALLCLLVFAGGFILLFNPEPQVQQSLQTPVKAEPPTVEELFKLTNEERAKVGVKPLKLDAKLNKSALLKVQDMYKYGYYGHVNPETGKNGPEIVFDSGYPECKTASENLASGGDYHKTAGAVIDDWMNSKSHRDALLLGKYTNVGFAVSADYTVMHLCDIM